MSADVAAALCRAAEPEIDVRWTPLIVVLGLALTAAPPSRAQDDTAPPQRPAAPLTPPALVEKSVRDLAHGAVGKAVNDDVKALRRGPLLIHGNYCGVGNRPGTPPVDALDAACMRHDACTKTGKLPSCACDDRLRTEATEIAKNPETPPDMKAMAVATASAMAVLICKSGPVVTVPAVAAPAPPADVPER